MNRAIVSLCAVIAVLITVYLVGHERGQRSRNAEVAQLKADHALVLADLAEKTAATVVAVRERERTYNQESAAAADTARRDKADALAVQKSVIAGLRADVIRLRSFWNARPAACLGDAAVPAVAGGDTENARLRAESAGRIIGNGREADVWIRWLQRELTITRAACDAPK